MSHTNLNDIWDKVGKRFVDLDLLIVFFDLLLLSLELMRDPHDFRFHDLQTKARESAIIREEKEQKLSITIWINTLH